MAAHTHHAIEAAKTVMEVAELAFTAVEHLHHHEHHHQNPNSTADDLRKENIRLRELLQQNLKLLENLSTSPCALNDCPPDLHDRLLAAVNSEGFLTRVQSLHNGSADGTKNEFPFKEPTGADLESAEVLINVDKEEPSWWVWVTDEMVPGRVEERSGIDNDNYVVVCEEHVVDGVANFIARCIVSNPKVEKLTPEQLQKIVTKSLGGVNKVEKMLSIWHAGKLFYVLSTWGLAFTGLYQTRGVLKLAAHGVHHTSKLALTLL